jgi:hypothetical protein
VLISEEKTVSYTYTCGALDVLLSPSVMFIAHVHDRSSLTPILLLAENANEVFLNFSRNSTDRSLLPWTVFSVACSFSFHEA